MSRLPQRIVCLTTETVEVLYAIGTETVEVLYAIGEAGRIAGISGYTVRPPAARKEKPKGYAFTTGDIDRILAVCPDMVLTFSDLQADIARDLIKIDDMLGMIETIGRLVGAEARALQMVRELEAQIEDARAIATERIACSGRRPRVGLGADRDRRRRQHLRRLRCLANGPRPHPRRPARSRRPCPRHHHRLMVRQALPARARFCPSRLVDPYPPWSMAGCTRSSRPSS